MGDVDVPMGMLEDDPGAGLSEPLIEEVPDEPMEGEARDQ